jgi:hypothetical protein
MEQSEPLDANVKRAEIELKKQHEQVESEKKRARERTESDQRQLSETRNERAAIAGSMTPKMLAEYKRIHKKTKGTVVADATDGHCDACHIALRPQFFQDLRKGDSVMFCESCGRMLTYNPVIDVSEPSPSQTVA